MDGGIITCQRFSVGVGVHWIISVVELDWTRLHCTGESREDKRGRARASWSVVYISFGMIGLILVDITVCATHRENYGFHS
jgi:hypothetical protein